MYESNVACGALPMSSMLHLISQHTGREKKRTFTRASYINDRHKYSLKPQDQSTAACLTPKAIPIRLVSRSMCTHLTFDETTNSFGFGSQPDSWLAVPCALIVTTFSRLLIYQTHRPSRKLTFLTYIWPSICSDCLSRHLLYSTRSLLTDRGRHRQTSQGEEGKAGSRGT